MQLKKWKILFSFFLLTFPFTACSSEKLSAVRIIKPTGELRATFRVELAQSPAEHAQGLMYRKELGKNRGMLFVFPTLTTTAFWMKNTLIYLDMIFVGSDKKIISIVENATPQSETLRRAAGPYQYVLEIMGGRAQALGIQVGDQLEFQ